MPLPQDGNAKQGFPIRRRAGLDQVLWTVHLALRWSGYPLFPVFGVSGQELKRHAPAGLDKHGEKDDEQRPMDLEHTWDQEPVSNLPPFPISLLEPYHHLIALSTSPEIHLASLLLAFSGQSARFKLGAKDVGPGEAFLQLPCPGGHMDALCCGYFSYFVVSETG